ncbi:glycosidase PH1107-related, partial [Arthrobacter sp. Hiyo6]
MTSPETSTLPTVPFTLTRAGVIMTPEAGNEFEAEASSTRPAAADPTASCTCCRASWPR